MTATKRTDKYQIGDPVVFVEVDEYVGPTIIPQEHRRKFGQGPYIVEDIEDVTHWVTSPGHTQLVWINGERYSGAWFDPVRQDEEVAA